MDGKPAMVELLPIKDPLARYFYAEMCRIEHWDVRTLRLKTDYLWKEVLREERASMETQVPFRNTIVEALQISQPAWPVAGQTNRATGFQLRFWHIPGNRRTEAS